MKKQIIASLILFSSTAYADPTIFNMELGKTTEAEVKEMYPVENNGVNRYSDGNQYLIPVSKIEFDGLKRVSVIFDDKGILVAVLTTLPNTKFDYLNGILAKKYQLVKKEIPFVGTKLVTFKDGDSKIELNSPHLDFDMYMDYIRNDFLKIYEQKKQEEKNQKTKNEASQL